MDPIDLSRLERVRRWGDVPPSQRTEEWIREFEAAFWPAPLVASADRLLYGGTDGRPYQVVSFHDGEAGPRSIRPAALVDELIEGGRGLWFGVEGEEPKCVFTLGEILSYRLYGRAFAMLPPGMGDGNVVVPPGERISLAPPNEANFPSWARLNVRRHLQTALRIAEPRACGVRFSEGKEGIGLDLKPASGMDEATLRREFDAIRWLLPARLAYYRFDALSDHEAMRPF